MRERKRRLWHETPYDGVPGFWAAWLRFFYQFEGAAQLGKRDEPAYIPDPNPSCPVCGQPMKAHRIDRGGPGARTHLICPPKAESEPESAEAPEPEAPEAETSFTKTPKTETSATETP